MGPRHFQWLAYNDDDMHGRREHKHTLATVTFLGRPLWCHMSHTVCPADSVLFVSTSTRIISVCSDQHEFEPEICCGTCCSWICMRHMAATS